MRAVFPSLAALCIGVALIEASQAQTIVQQDERHYDPSWSFDVSGELRERYESVNNLVFGLVVPMHNDYLLHRAVLSGEARRGDFRSLVEIVSGLASGWDGSPPPTQKDPLDVMQAYVEKSVALSSGQLALRAGRQGLKLGSSRLVSIRESPNIRRAFDGVRATLTRDETGSLTAFLVRPVFPERGVFDDDSSSRQRFWGVYATRPVRAFEALGVDVYYLGLHRADALFAQGKARELRHTVGVRVFGEREAWDWNIEGAWQWGSFGDSDIGAWTVSADVGFEFSEFPLSPRIGLKADAISGDRDPHDRQLNTFNPLFPRLPYFSEANLATPANLLDVQPNLRLALTSQLSATVNWNRLWKHEAADAYYAPPLVPVAATANTRSRDIGWQASTLIEWQMTERLEFNATYVTFAPRSVVKRAGGRAGSFFGVWVQWTF